MRKGRQSPTARARGAKASAPRTGDMRPVTAAEARRRSRTDWARVDATTDEDIARQITEDPDTPPDLSGDEWAARVVVVDPPPKKTPISFRVDPDVLAWFRRQGAGYQSRMNAVLRAYMEHRAREGKKGSVP